jgi:hypothetical protein
MSTTSFLAPADPFGRTARLAHEASFPVLGVPLRVRSNAEAAVGLAADHFGSWLGLTEHLVDRSLQSTLDVVVHPETADPMPASLSYRRHGPVFLAAGVGVQIAVVLDTRHAVAFVPRQALDDREWFCAHVGGFALLAATQRTRVPLHAAAVVAGSQTLLLAGHSGAGKSTMAYACAAAGFSVLAEDTVFAELGARPVRLWGQANQIWLAADSPRFFPELADEPVVARANGKQRIAARAAMPWSPTLTTAGDAAIVLLERRDDGRGGAPILTRLEADHVTRLIDHDATSGFDQYPDERPQLTAWLQTLPAYGLDCGASPQQAARLLEALVLQRAGAISPTTWAWTADTPRACS